ncbi:MAG: hypothetical protein [Circular genetic element sp.]|nr:MAG: hypothetical protein [Circular genetic element sp.]
MNPLDIKHNIAGQPYRIARRIVGPTIDDDPELMVAMMGATYTAAANLAAPLALVQSGYRGNRYFTGLSVGYSKLGYPMPLFNYVTPASGAEKFGARLGGKLGSAAMQTMGHITPLVGWMPGADGGIVKLKLSPWIKKAGTKTGAKIGGRVAGRLLPGVGWGLLAYDVYDVAVNRSLWGFDLD